ncbi:MAG TPA: gliding motility-associated C-terminal domain-containing protein [Bacteroidales bacterium]|nr:gliding motility-associated C-terminal domain-containing protein [Bacteroidales bacterium]
MAIILILSFLSLQAQELTNSGREFWVTSSVNSYSNIMPDSALIYIMGDTLCTGYIENPNTSFSRSFTVIPNSVLIIAIPKNDILCNVPLSTGIDDTTRIIEAKGVYIHTEKNVYVYLQTNYADSIRTFSNKQTAKVPILPLSIYSSEIRLHHLPIVGHSIPYTLMIIATEDNTMLYVPELVNGNFTTYPFNVVLQKGEVFQFTPSRVLSYGDTNKVITTNCKKVVYYFTSKKTTLNVITSKQFLTIPSKHLYKGKDFLLIKFIKNDFIKSIKVNNELYYSMLPVTIFRCNQFPVFSLTYDIAVSNRLEGCTIGPPWLIDVPFAFIRSLENRYGFQLDDAIFVNFIYTGSGIWMQRISNEEISYTNYNYSLPANRMVKKWIIPTTLHHISKIPDSTYVDLVIFVKPEGIHTMYINHQLIPSTAFDTFPFTNGDYYYLQYGLFNDSIPDFFMLENENGFSATIDEFGYNMRPNTNGLMDFIYFHNNDSGVNYYDSPVPYSNLSPVDSATVYRCVGDQLHLEVPYNPDYIPIDWIVDGTLYPNTPTVDMLLNTADTLTVQLVLQYNCPDTTTTFVVVVSPPVIPCSTDTILCQGTELTVETPNAIHYLWSTGDTTASIVIDTAGLYSVSVSNLGCQITLNDIHVQLYPQSSVNLGNDSILCALATLVLNAEQPHPANYLWQDLSTNTTYLVQLDGQYWVVVTDECLHVSDTINLGFLYPIEIDLGNDTTLCEGQHLLLSAETPYCNYLWQDGSTLSSYLVKYAGVYEVLVSNLCFNQSSAIEVSYQQCEQEIFIPNSFTPNSDGLNDQFRPLFTYPEKIEEYSIFIYNRWGNLVFTTQNIEQGWNGNHCLNGVYAYVIFYKTKGEGGKIVKGSVTIY